MRVAIPADMAIDAEVDLNLATTATPQGAPQRQPAGPGARRRPGAGRRGAPDVPVFQAIRGNVDVTINVI